MQVEQRTLLCVKSGVMATFGSIAASSAGWYHADNGFIKHV